MTSVHSNNHGGGGNEALNIANCSSICRSKYFSIDWQRLIKKSIEVPICDYSSLQSWGWRSSQEPFVYIKSLQKPCSVLIQVLKCSNSIRELQSRCFSFSKHWNCSFRHTEKVPFSQARFSPKVSVDPSPYIVSPCAFFSPQLFYSACFKRFIQSFNVLMKGDTPQINSTPGTVWCKQNMTLPSLSQAPCFLLFGSAPLATISLGQLILPTM